MPLINMCSVRTCVDVQEKRQKFPDPNKTPFLFNEWVKLTGNQKLFKEFTAEEIYAKECICSLHFELTNNNSIIHNICINNGLIRRDIPVYPTLQLPKPLNEDKVRVTTPTCYSCCVPNCTTKQIDQVFSKKFPDHPGLYRLWVSNINRPDLYKISQKSVLTTYRLCNLHFEEYQKYNNTCLIRNAIPTVLLPPESYAEHEQFLEGIQEKEHDPRLDLESEDSEENVSCCVPTCVYDNLFKHRFPEPNNDENIEELNLWIMLIGDKTLRELSKEDIYKNYRICSGHFLNSDYDSNGELKTNSYPCLTLPNPLPPIKPTKIICKPKLKEVKEIPIKTVEQDPLAVNTSGVSNNNIPGTSIDKSKVIVLKHADFYNKNITVISAKDPTEVIRVKTYGTPRLSTDISSTLTISKFPALITEVEEPVVQPEVQPLIVKPSILPTPQPIIAIKYPPKRKGVLLNFKVTRTKQFCLPADVQ